MLVIKFLSSHVDLSTGENKHTMVIGRPDQPEGIEIDLDPVSYMQLGQVTNELFGRPLQHQQAHTTPQPSEELFHKPPGGDPLENEVQLEARLRAMEATGNPHPDSSGSAEDLLRQVGWFDSKEAASPPNNVLADFEEEDRGEDYPEEDGTEAV